MTKIIRLILVFTLSIVVANASISQTKPQVARIKGKIINSGSIVSLEDFSELQMLIPASENHRISIGPDSSFAIEIPLLAPKYFRLGRNKIYLSPGDRMVAFIDFSSSSLSNFNGRGAIANNYLADTPFPKGGSYVESGENIAETPQKTLDLLQQYFNDRSTRLKSLKNVSSVFVELETARNRADLIKSIDAVDSYKRLKLRNKTSEFIKQYSSDFKQLTRKLRDSLMSDFIRAKYLQLEVYRDIVHLLPQGKANNADVKEIAEWTTASRLASEIKQINDKSKLLAFKTEIAEIQTPRFKIALTAVYGEKAKFGNGDNAVDLVVIKTDGTKAILSSLKGKVIYIDIWATWCGPCMGEMPNLEILKARYKDYKDVVIVALSVDETDKVWKSDLEKRKPEGIQWRIERANLASYSVTNIPRYILIDKNFKIAEMHAPHPSDKKLIPMLEKLINQM